MPDAPSARPDRALLLNLTFWAADSGGDVLVDDRIEADVVAHAAWHHLSARALAHDLGAPPGPPPSVDALFLGEAIASAFDVYLVGRLLGHAPQSTFLETQVPAMALAASAAGLSEDEFERRLGDIAAESSSATRARRSSPAAVARRPTPLWPRSTSVPTHGCSTDTSCRTGCSTPARTAVAQASTLARATSTWPSGRRGFRSIGLRRTGSVRP
jgi:hypothetical protein